MSRVEIEGQFDPSNPYKSCVGKQPFQVTRQEQLHPNQQPTNWSRFCDEVDTTLQKLQKPKELYQRSSILMVLLILVCVLPNLLFEGIFVDKEKDGELYISLYAVYMVIILVLVFAYTFIWCR